MGKKIKIELTLPQLQTISNALDVHREGIEVYEEYKDAAERAIVRAIDRAIPVLQKAARKSKVVIKKPEKKIVKVIRKKPGTWVAGKYGELHWVEVKKK